MSESQEQAIQAAPPTPAGRMIGILGGIAMLSGFLVVLTEQLTAPIIAENQRIAIERAVLQIVPGAVTHREFLLTEENSLKQDAEPGEKGTAIYAGYDNQGTLKGIALRGGAQGYADMVHLLYGYDQECQCIRGFRVLKMAETPGLGDKILKDPNFLANFDALDAKLNAAGDGLENAIVTVKNGTKKHPWEIDAISGATITSVAVGKAMNRSAQALLPKLLPLVGQLEAAGTEIAGESQP